MPFTSTVAPTTSGPSSWSKAVAASVHTALPAIVHVPIRPDAGIACTTPLISGPPLAFASAANSMAASATSASDAPFHV